MDCPPSWCRLAGNIVTRIGSGVECFEAHLGRTAQGLAADLIAPETHGRRGLPRLLPGSVADKVIRGASVPVLVHRYAEK
jgi:nucleotide-binding universal stress UspA family protein